MKNFSQRFVAPTDVMIAISQYLLSIQKYGEVVSYARYVILGNAIVSLLNLRSISEKSIVAVVLSVK
jgi:hypothetical protein